MTKGIQDIRGIFTCPGCARSYPLCPVCRKLVQPVLHLEDCSDGAVEEDTCEIEIGITVELHCPECEKDLARASYTTDKYSNFRSFIQEHNDRCFLEDGDFTEDPDYDVDEEFIRPSENNTKLGNGQEFAFEVKVTLLCCGCLKSSAQDTIKQVLTLDSTEWSWALEI